MIDQNTKKEIAAHLVTFVTVHGSEVKAGTAINVSNATVNKIIKGLWDGISDAMFRKVAHGIGFNLTVHADTGTFKALTHYFNDARKYQNVFGAVCKEGSGKTYALDRYKAAHRHVAYFKCNRHTSARELLQGLFRSLGRSNIYGQIGFMLEKLAGIITQLDAPLIIIDEIEKTRPDILHMTIDLYNVLQGKAGIVYLGTPYLQKRLELGIQRGAMCFPEIFSRLGGRVIRLPLPSDQDAELIIRAHGISEQRIIRGIVNGSKNTFDEIDLRRVDRLVHAELLKEPVEDVA